MRRWCPPLRRQWRRWHRLAHRRGLRTAVQRAATWLQKFYTLLALSSPTPELMKKKGTPTNRECFPLVHQRPVQDDRLRTTTRDSAEHFPSLTSRFTPTGVK